MKFHTFKIQVSLIVILLTSLYLFIPSHSDNSSFILSATGVNKGPATNTSYTINPVGSHSARDFSENIIYGLMGGKTGTDVAVGDFNGDGIKDIAISAPGDDTDANNAGAVYLLLGPISTGKTDLLQRPPHLAIYGGIEGGRLGESLLFSDLNGDGRDELIIGAPSTPIAGAVYILLGGVDYGSEVHLPPSYLGMSGTPLNFVPLQGGDIISLWSDPFPEENLKLGATLSGGDVNGDGINDLLISQPFGSKAFLLWGNRTWPLTKFLTISSENGESNFAEGVELMDIDGDGLWDVVIGSPEYSLPALSKCGAVYIFYGNESLKNTSNVNTTSCDVLIEGDKQNLNLGYSIVKGRFSASSRYSDILISAPGAKNRTGKLTGAIYIVRGRERGYFQRIQSITNLYFLSIYGNQVASPLKTFTAFDFDGDGGDEVVVLRPSAFESGAMMGDVYVLYSISLLTPGSKERSIEEITHLRIYGKNTHDAFGSSAALLSQGIGYMLIGAAGADGPDGSRTSSGELYMVPLSRYRITGVSFSGLIKKPYGNAALAGKSFRLTTELFSSSELENISSIEYKVRDTGKNGENFTFNWSANGGVKEKYDPYNLATVSLFMVNNYAPFTLRVSIDITVSFLFPLKDNLTVDVLLLTSDGEGIIDPEVGRIKLLRGVTWEEKELTVTSGMCDISQSGSFVLPGEELNFRGPSIVYSEERDIHPNLSLFRAVLRGPEGVEKYSSLEGGFSISIRAPINASVKGYKYIIDLRWAGYLPPIPGAYPPLPLPYMYMLRVDNSPPLKPYNLSIEGKAGNSTTAYSRNGTFNIQWSERWVTETTGSLGVSQAVIKASGPSSSITTIPVESGGLKCVFFSRENFSGERLTNPVVALPVDWGVLGPDPSHLDPEGFSAILSGMIDVKDENTYRIGISSDTWAVVDLDDKTVLISKDGMWKYVTMTFQKGLHTIRIKYVHMGEEGCYINIVWNLPYQPDTPLDPSLQMHTPSNTTIQLDRGEWKVNVWGLDPFGMTGKVGNLTEIVNTMPPFIKKASASQWYSSRPFNMTVKVMDTGVGVDPDTISWSASIGGEDWGGYTSRDIYLNRIQEDGNNGYLVNIYLSLPDGLYNYIKIRAKDLVGNGYTISQPFQLKVDTTPPGLSIVSPSPDSIVSTSSVSLRLNIIDKLSGIDVESLKVYCPSEGWRSVSLGGFSQGAKDAKVTIPLTLNPGNNTFRISINDVAGNVKTTGDISYIYNPQAANQPPLAVITSPGNGSRYSTGTMITFDGRDTTDDGKGPLGGLKYYWVSNISGSIGSSPYFEKSLPRGKHLITLYVDDGQYNSSASVEITVFAPNINVPENPNESPSGGGLSSVEIGVLVIIAAAALFVGIWLYFRYLQTPDVESVIPIGPEE